MIKFFKLSRHISKATHDVLKSLKYNHFSFKTILKLDKFLLYKHNNFKPFLNNKKNYFSDINKTNNKVDILSIPYYCNTFKLSQILQIDMIDLIKNYKETLNQDVIDPMEYLNKDDLELFLLENGYEFNILEHKEKLVKRPMIVTIMGHVDHGNIFY